MALAGGHGWHCYEEKRGVFSYSISNEMAVKEFSAITEHMLSREGELHLWCSLYDFHASALEGAWCEALTKMLLDAPIRSVDLHLFRLSCDKAKALFGIIIRASPPHLEQLSCLFPNTATSPCLPFVFDHVRHFCPRLRFLSYCEAGVQHGPHEYYASIADFLRSGHCLRKLRLHDLRPENEDWRVMIDALCHNTTLTSLQLYRYQDPRKETVALMLKMLDTNITIRDITYPAVAIRDKMEANRALLIERDKNCFAATIVLLGIMRRRMPQHIAAYLPRELMTHIGKLVMSTRLATGWRYQRTKRRK